MRSRLRALFPLALVACLGLASLLGSNPAAAGTHVVQRKVLAPGVVYKQIHDPAGPWRIYVVTFDPAKEPTLDVELGGSRLKGTEVTSSIASRKHALAAINGDYPRPSGRPVHTYVEDGKLMQKESVYGRNFALARGEKYARVGHPRVKRTLEVADQLLFPVDLINETAPGENQIAEYGPEAKGVSGPPKNSCAVRVRARKAPYFAPKKRVARSYQVKETRCGKEPLNRNGHRVLAARSGERRELIRAMAPGDVIDLEWTIGWGGVLDSIGGNPDILDRGEIPRESTIGCGSFCGPHPRTGIGWTKDGQVLMVVVDGRSERSAGMTLHEFAKLFRSMGAVEALNVDGGGSSTMWIKGLGVVNVPSDGPERPVSSAFLIFGGRDPDEKVSKPPPDPTTPDPDPTPEPPDPGPVPTLPPLPPIPPSTEDLEHLWQRAASDPASTGGLASSLRKQGYRLPPYMKEAIGILGSDR
jgi:Phosphodiester glycosidase